MPAQAPLWRNDWLVPGYPSLVRYLGDLSRDALDAPVPVVFSPDGDVLLRTPAPSFADDEFVRLGADGSVRWRANLGSPSASYDSGQAMLANADGSAIVGTQGGAAIAKIDAAGQVLWATAVAADRLLASPTGNVIAFSGASGVSGIDPVSGQVLWQHPPADGYPTGIALSPAGDIYVSLISFGVGSATLEVEHLDPAGAPLWRVRQDASADANLVVAGATANNVYLTDDLASGATQQTQALHAQDGTPAWTVAGQVLIGFVGAPLEPVLSSAAGTARVAEADGAAHWLQPSANARFLAAVGPDRLLVGGHVLDAGSGAIEWSVAATTPDALGNPAAYFAFGQLGDGSVLGAAAAPGSPAPVVLQRFDAASGTPLARLALPSSAQSVELGPSIADALRLISAADFPGANGTQMRLRAVAADDGRTLWETSDESLAGSSARTPYPLARVGDAVLIAATTDRSVWIAAYDVASGAKRWDRFFDGLPAIGLPDEAQAGAPQAAAIVADADGNPVVSFSLNVACAGGQTVPPCGQTTVAKLDRGDGDVVWRRDQAFDHSQFPQKLVAAGGHLVLGGPFAAPEQSTTLMDVDSADGSVRWRSAYMLYAGVDDIFAAADGNLLLSGFGNWAEIDAQTGATVWNNPIWDDPFHPDCSYATAVVLPNGDIAASGSTTFAPTEQPCVVVLPYGAGAAARVWKLDSADAEMQGRAFDAQVDASGRLWFRIARYSDAGSLRTLAEFDPVHGSVLGEQALFVQNYTDPLRPWLDPIVIQAPSPDRRLLAPSVANDPPAAATYGAVLLDLGAAAHGDLALRVTSDRTAAAPGDAVNFHAIVTYAGDAPIAGAEVLIASPWQTHADDIACAAAGAGNCSARENTAQLSLTFDIQPGGQIDVSGRFPALDAAVPKPLAALVVGPKTLVESDLANNFAQVTIRADAIFAAGFE